MKVFLTWLILSLSLVSFAYSNSATDRQYILGLVAYNHHDYEDAEIILSDLVAFRADECEYPIAYFVLGKIYLRPEYDEPPIALDYFRRAYGCSSSDRELKRKSLIMIKRALKRMKK